MQQSISKKEEECQNIKVILETEKGERWSGMAEQVIVDQHLPVPYSLWDSGPLMPGGDDSWDMKIYGLGVFVQEVAEDAVLDDVRDVISEAAHRLGILGDKDG